MEKYIDPKGKDGDRVAWEANIPSMYQGPQGLARVVNFVFSQKGAGKPTPWMRTDCDVHVYTVQTISQDPSFDD